MIKDFSRFLKRGVTSYYHLIHCMSLNYSGLLLNQKTWKVREFKETSESQGICRKSQGICDKIPKVKEKSENFVV